MLKNPVLSFSTAAILGLSFSAVAADVSGAGAKTGKLVSAPRAATPFLAKAEGKDETWRKAIRPQPGFEVATWAAEPHLGNPVAFTFDDQGRLFTSETNRYRTSVLDIRHYMFMLEDDLAARTVEDRIAYTKKNFPSDWQQLEKETEVIRFVEDSDGDGKADRSRVFADGFNTILDGIASGVLALDGKVWFTNIPNLWMLDAPGADGKSPKRESLSFGWGVRYSYTGHDFHGLAMGPDGRLYFSIGDRGATVKTKEGKVIAMPDEGGVFRCEPDGANLEVVMRGLRNPQELAFDDHGNLFTGDNDSDQGDRERWVYVTKGADAGWRVGWQHNFQGPRNPWISEKMWEPRDAKKGQPAAILSPIMNIPDGPSGVAYYPGTGLPAEFAGHFFVCGFKGSTAKSAISTWKVKENGAGFSVEKAPAEFLGATQATDVEFGPDSRIYLSDWGAEGWESQGRGRIYSVTHTSAYEAQKAQVAEVKKLLAEGMARRGSDELAKLLAHPDQRIRLRAQWALAKKADGAGKFLAAAQSGAGLARLHGIWGLGHMARLGALKRGPVIPLTPVVALLKDKDAEVRAQAARVIGDNKFVAATDTLIGALKDESLRVRFYAAQALAELGAKSATPALIALLAENADKDEYLRHAAVHALAKSNDAAAIAGAAKHESRSVRLGALLAMRMNGWPSVGGFLKDSDAGIVREAVHACHDGGNEEALAALAGHLPNVDREDEQQVIRALNAAYRTGNAKALATFAASRISEPMRVEALTLLAQWAKPAARNRVTGNFQPLAPRDAAPAAAAIAGVLPAFLQTRDAAITSATEPVNIAAAEAVTALGVKAAGPLLASLVANDLAKPKARLAAFKALAALGVPELDAAVASAIGDKEPTIRVEATAILGKRDPAKAAEQLATAFPKADLDEKKAIISALGTLKAAQADTSLAKLVGDMKAGNIPVQVHLELIEAASARTAPEVKAALAAYETALAAETNPVKKHIWAIQGGDPDLGKKAFTESAIGQCMRCHKIKGTGGDAGPELSVIAAKYDAKTLLESIVEPNAKIAEGFQSIMVTLKNGDVQMGVVKAEDAAELTIQPTVPGAAPVKIKVADIKSRDTAPSGMPPGYGLTLPKRDLRDIMAYLQTLK